jgi:hypothetical protein
MEIKNKDSLDKLVVDHENDEIHKKHYKSIIVVLCQNGFVICKLKIKYWGQRIGH